MFGLWFASILLFLHYEPQRVKWWVRKTSSCDLLRFYYFCIMNPNPLRIEESCHLVVICFDFIIFALWIPTRVLLTHPAWWLWFASILLFLHYESQRRGRECYYRACCDLLRFYYFCIMNPNNPLICEVDDGVVICFDFIIFALWIPTDLQYLFVIQWFTLQIRI